MLKHLLLFLFLCSFTYTYCQNRNSVWCFGDSAGIDFSNPNNPLPIFTSLRTRGSCVSISDTVGNLLFYGNTRVTLAGNTTLVWNKQHNLMVSGDSIVGRGWYKELTVTPVPYNPDLYYLFSAGVSSINGFFYSVIDMTRDSGRGMVVQKNVQLQGSNFWANDGVAAVKHGNGRDWWVMVRDWSNVNNTFFFYLVTPFGVILNHTQNIGDVVQSGFFRIEPSIDGRKIACVSNNGLLCVYDFNRCSGMLGNELSIEHEVTNPNLAPWYWDCELSPSSSLLYVSKANSSQTDSISYVFQYELNYSNPSLTRDTIFAINKPITGGLLELAPDNKIYWSCWYSPPFTFYYPYPDSVRNIYNENLSVINYPDSVGTVCNFQHFSFYLGGKRTYIGLPNNPNYELPKDSGSICDTLTVGMQEIEIQNSALLVFYYPQWQKAFINAQKLKGKNYLLAVYDLLGNLIVNEQGKLKSEYYTKDLNMQTFSSGLYIVSLTTEKEKLVKKFIKQ